VRNDIGLIFEAYRKVCKEANETGAVVSPNKSVTTSSTPLPQAVPGAAGVTTPQNVSLSIDDVKKILKNISDSFTKAKDTADILQKNNVPGSLQALQSGIQNLPSYILNIISLASPTTQQLSMLSKSLSLAPQIASMVNNVIKNLGPSGGGEQTPASIIGGVADTNSRIAIPNTPARLAIPKTSDAAPAGASVTGAVSDTGDGATIKGAPVQDDTVAPAAPATGDETVAPGVDPTKEEPVRKATLPDGTPAPSEGPYYVMTTKGPRLTTKGTPGAYQINKPSANK